MISLYINTVDEVDDDNYADDEYDGNDFILEDMKYGDKFLIFFDFFKVTSSMMMFRRKSVDLFIHQECNNPVLLWK